MHVIIIYATVEGQTRKIARNIAGTVQSSGHDVTVFDSRDLEDLDLTMADSLIVAAPVHAGLYSSGMRHWLKDNHAAVNAIPSAFVSVSLGAASPFPAEHREIDEIIQAMLDETGWKPAAVHSAAGALRYTKYDFIKRLLIRHIAEKEGGSVDTSADHEYTDWVALNDFVTAFLEKAEKA